MTPSTTTRQYNSALLRCFLLPRRAIATTTTCIFRGPTLTPRHHHYLPHNLNPHGRCHNHQLHPPFPRHNHRHTLTHNHNHFNHHRFCPTLPPLHWPTAHHPLGLLSNHVTCHRNPHIQLQCFRQQHLPRPTCCHHLIPHHRLNFLLLVYSCYPGYPWGFWFFWWGHWLKTWCWDFDNMMLGWLIAQFVGWLTTVAVQLGGCEWQPWDLGKYGW